MSIVGLRYDGGFPVYDGDPAISALQAVDKARWIVYPPGKYDVTPKELLFPSMRHLLTVTYREVESDMIGIYSTSPRDKFVTMTDSRSSLDTTVKMRSQQTMLGKEPIVIARPDIEGDRAVMQVLLILLTYQDPLPSMVEAPKAELRRDIVNDVQIMLRKSKNGRLSQAKLIESLVKLDAFYKGRSSETFIAVLEELVRFGYVRATKNAQPQMYYL